MMGNESAKKARIGIIVQGRVQGVGFRPFIWRTATELGLTGFVRNTSAGVRIEAQGSAAALNELERRLSTNLPPLAEITSLKHESLPVERKEHSFLIEQSSGHAGQSVLVSPDIGVCAACLEDIRDSGNPRHGYAFTNCVNCGPRFSITRSIPYDRASTVMACFPLCPDCAAEYSDPSNRRFHAQPIACASCGPGLWHVSREERDAGKTQKTPLNQEHALEKTAMDILSGKIVAFKGLGGFQLACDARNVTAIGTLRERKKRPHKALAVMARDIESIGSFCVLDDAHIRLLSAPQKPIVLCPKKFSSFLPDSVAPDVPEIGVMLPYTPLHALLFDWLHEHGFRNPVLIMTSANPSGEPICLGNREALNRLSEQADSWLLHDRDILVRVDDSVVGVHPVEKNSSIMFRRARGHVPVPLELPNSANVTSVLGTGADLKATFCLTRGGKAFLSQHIGDLENIANMGFYEESLQHMRNLLECAPALVVHDLHPNFQSTVFAKKLAQTLGVSALPLQHHAAHAASVLAENGLFAPSLALCLDGTGLGIDGKIWGGELLLMDLSRPQWKRVGSFAPFALPGGEKAIIEPWRIACGMRFRSGEYARAPAEKAEAALYEMLERNINCPECSSCGRLFDAVAAQLGICGKITYEGQAATRLMNAAWSIFSSHGGSVSSTRQSWLLNDGDIPLIDSYALFKATAEIHAKSGNAALAAAFFHEILTDALFELCQNCAQKYSLRDIGLSGGVLQNRLLTTLLHGKLLKADIKPYYHRQTPPGDGGISFGQAAWGCQCLLNASDA